MDEWESHGMIEAGTSVGGRILPPTISVRNTKTMKVKKTPDKILIKYSRKIRFFLLKTLKVCTKCMLKLCHKRVKE